MATLDMQQTVLSEMTENEQSQEEIQLTELLPVKQSRFKENDDIFEGASTDANANANANADISADAATDALKILRSFSITDSCNEDEQEFRLRNLSFYKRIERQGKQAYNKQWRGEKLRKRIDEGGKVTVGSSEIDGKGITIDERTWFEDEAMEKKGVCLVDRKSVKSPKNKAIEGLAEGREKNDRREKGSVVSRRTIEEDVFLGVEKGNYLTEYNEQPTYLDLDKNNHFNDEMYVFRRESFDSGQRRNKGKSKMTNDAEEIRGEINNVYPMTTDGVLFARMAIASRESSGEGIAGVVETIDDKRLVDERNFAADARTSKPSRSLFLENVVGRGSSLNVDATSSYLVEGENNNVVRSSRLKIGNGRSSLSGRDDDGIDRNGLCKEDRRRRVDGETEANGEEQVRDENRQKKYCCVVCEARFKGSGGLRNHYKIVHGAGPIFRCDECGKEFPLKERLKLHVRTHTGFKPYKCSECDKSFARGGQLVQHRRTHSQVKPYRCGLCSGTFTCAANLALHVKRHNGQKDHKCEICGRAFVRRDALKKHLECLHRDVKSFLCVICNKTFKGHLPQHMRTHARDRPHGCATCGQRFAQKSQLTVHQRTHSGQRPFRCLVCWQAFAHSTALKLHTRRHTGERPFKCAECNAGFTQLPHWKKHMKCIHGRNEPYACKKCKSFFRIKNDLECHEKTCHPEFECDLNGPSNSVDRGSSAPSISNDIIDKSSSPLPSKYRVMTVERMRLLLAVLFKRISKQERLDELGFGKRLIDEVLHDSLISAGKDPVPSDGLSELETLTKNLEIFLKWTVPKEHWENFRRLNKSPEDILETLTAT